MTQLGMGVAALNHDSAFQAAYERGIKKTEYWTYALEDSLNLIAKLPAIAARIYRNVYNPGKSIPDINKDLDLVGEYNKPTDIPGLDYLSYSSRQLCEHAGIWK
jgi:citrate synthase